MALTRPPAVSVFGITALIPGVGRFNALSSVASLLMMLLLIVAGAAAANGDLRLVEAARNRDQQTVRTLLNQHADVDVRSHDGATALLWAAHWNDLETADLLIRAGANVNAANDLRITPLSLACTNGNAALVERLLKAGASPNNRDRDWRNANDDVREHRQRGRRPDADGSWRRCQCEGAVAESDRVDVGRSGASSGGGPSAH